jgi:hypothetical protein
LPVAVIISVGTSGLTLSSTITQVFQTRIHDAIMEGYDDWRNIAISLMTMKAVLALSPLFSHRKSACLPPLHFSL